MKVQSKLLIAALAFPTTIAKKKSFLPTASALRLEAAEGTLSIRAADGDQFVEQSIQCDGDLAPICISAHGINTIAGFFKESVKLELEKGTLKIDSGGKFQLKTSEAADFPAYPEKELKLQGINAEELADAIEQVRFAAHESPAVAERYGVHVKSEAKKLMAEATDGLRFARCEKLIISAETEIFIPAQFLDSLTLALKSEKPKLKLSQNMIAVSFKGGNYACKLGVLNFPNVAACFKGEQQELGEIQPSKWLPIFTGAAAFSGQDATQTCKVSIEGNSFEHVGKNGALELKLPDKLDGPQLNLNGQTFISCLSAFGTDKAKVLLSEETKAVFLKNNSLTVITSQLRES